jgi:hypothetical protein
MQALTAVATRSLAALNTVAFDIKTTFNAETLPQFIMKLIGNVFSDRASFFDALLHDHIERALDFLWTNTPIQTVL